MIHEQGMSPGMPQGEMLMMEMWDTLTKRPEEDPDEAFSRCQGDDEGRDDQALPVQDRDIQTDQKDAG
jgi:hypothetical protein